jgi:hypothetical protein
LTLAESVTNVSIDLLLNTKLLVHLTVMRNIQWQRQKKKKEGEGEKKEVGCKTPRDV